MLCNVKTQLPYRGYKLLQCTTATPQGHKPTRRQCSALALIHFDIIDVTVYIMANHLRILYKNKH